MPASPLTLYADAFWISPYVYTVYVALREKGLSFAVTDVALHEKAQLAPEFRSPTVTGRVPALEHGDFWLGESSAIVDYLEEVFPAPAYPRLLPEGVRDRARARQILAWLRSDLDALRAERSTNTMFYERAREPLSAAGERAAAKLVEVASALVAEGAVSLFGDYSIADTDLSFMLHRLILNGHAVPPKLRAFADAQWQRPSVRAFVTHERIPFVPYF